MSYDVWLERGKSRSKVKPTTLGQLPRGINYRVAPENEPVTEADLRIGITYNYAPYFYKYLNRKEGIRWLYGKKAKDVLPQLVAASCTLNRVALVEEPLPREHDYFQSCAANAKKAIDGLITLARVAPGFTFNGD